MTWFSTVFNRNRRFLNFGSAIIILLLITISGGVIRPLLGNIALSIFHYPFSELKNGIEGLNKVAEDNRNLKNSLTEASLQLNSLAEARRENFRLREFLGFEPPENFQVVPVRIVSLGHNQYPISAVINKGTNDSIKVNQPVINRFGLVGKIKEVMTEFSMVQLLTDPANAVSARIAESRQFGIVRYIHEEGMIFDNLPADASINKGDLIISSGLGGIYPSGLTIGVVDSVLAVRGEIKKSIWLKPGADFLEIEELYVLESVSQ
ncbi:MAG: rod shape-determining protein MreC [candidate division Zixibacteria bacterium]|nr:rod shape-determining protein MreC [candidate division Zixibacteria bacterium]